MTLELKIPNLACSSCTQAVTKAVKTVDANAMVLSDVKNKRVSIETRSSETAIKQVLTSAGYPPVA